MTPDTPVPVVRPENEAAERLRRMVDSQPFDGPFVQVFDAALATERRLTVERIRAAVGSGTNSRLSQILDEEANR